MVGRKIIGPELFPLYLRIPSINLWVTLLIFAGIAIAFANYMSFTNVVAGALGNLAIQFTVVTAIFAYADRYLARHPEQWDPYAMGRSPVRKRQRSSRAESIFELIVLVIAGLWWLGVPAGARAVFHPAGDFMTVGPAWPPFPHMFTHAATAAASFYCVGIGLWVVVRGADLATQNKVAIINSWCNTAVTVFGVFNVLLFLFEAWRALRTQRAPAGSANAGITL